MRIKYTAAKRGDTIVEVMFAFAIFSLVAIITVTMMNLGVAAAERSLEMTVVRNEMNAQAEALRFVHSSYVAELTLPEECDSSKKDAKCQQYANLWKEITEHAVNENSIKMPVLDCQKIYSDNLLSANNAFVLNTRQLLSTKSGNYNLTDGYVTFDSNLFTSAPLNARIIYISTSGGSNEDGNTDNSTGWLGNSNDPLLQFTRIAKVEGIWAVAVKSNDNNSHGDPVYYDFHIGTCWNGSGSPSATSLDTIIRLYNPEKSS